MHPAPGTKAPAFSLPDESGNVRSLADDAGSWVLLYFYPKDDTSGCTVQACGVRDNFKKFQKLKCQVYGISADNEESHVAFIKKNALNFHLLADTEKKAVSAYDVWREKSMYGKKYMGIVRTSFLIDPKGNIAKVYENVDPDEHAAQVLADLQPGA